VAAAGGVLRGEGVVIGFSGYKRVRITEIVKPGGWRAAMKAPHLAGLMQSIRERGTVLHAPIIRKSTMEIVAGADRIAALDALGAEWVEVRMWDGTDAEMLAVRRDENLRRRQFSAAELAAMADDTTSELSTASELSDNVEELEEKRPPKKRKPGRPKTPRAAAIEDVAAKAGVSVKTVERAVAKEAEKHEPPPKPPSMDLPAPAALLRAGLLEVSGLLVRAQGRLTALLKELPVKHAEHADLAPLHRQIHAAAVKVRDAVPARVCIYCKLVKGQTEHCAACKGVGYSLDVQLRDAPKELLREGDAAGIFLGEKFRTLADLA
jgi:ParB-like chromosome segregation protein Spo0J